MRSKKYGRQSTSTGQWYTRITQTCPDKKGRYCTNRWPAYDTSSIDIIVVTEDRYTIQ